MATSTILISPSVMVPVLSVQITVVEPNVSAAKSCLTRAFSFNIFCMPKAKMTVITTKSPSGIIATDIATAVKNICSASYFKSTPRAKIIKQMPIAKKLNFLANTASFLWSGVIRSAVSATSFAIFPSAVSLPWATTMPKPLPCVTCVPIKAILDWSANTRSPARGLFVFSISFASPVKGASFIFKLFTFKILKSAGILSPAVTKTKSPGTSSKDIICFSWPPRSTLQ